MKIENIEVYGFRAALRGMRNPKDSWDRSDSKFGGYYGDECNVVYKVPGDVEQGFWHSVTYEVPRIGPKDMKLAKGLIKPPFEKGGAAHRKFLRQIMIWFDITVPIYVWSEFDTYKVATVRNSCSTMHKLGSRDLTQDDFEQPIPGDWLILYNVMGEAFRAARLNQNKEEMNRIRHEYKNLLSSGFLQKATFMMSYETALSMYFQRRGHRLPEWRADSPSGICAMLASLPYMQDFIAAIEE